MKRGAGRRRPLVASGPVVPPGWDANWPCVALPSHIASAALGESVSRSSRAAFGFRYRGETHMRLRSMGARRALVASALLALAALTVVAGGSAARTPEASGAEGSVDVQWTPVGLRDAKTTVILQLAGDPVTVAEANAGRKLNAAEKSAIKADLKAKQDAISQATSRHSAARCSPTTRSPTTASRCGSTARKLNSLRALKGVTAVRGLPRVVPDNVKGVQLIGAPSVWGGLAGLHGEDIKIAVIDTGIDYTHANFGGPGTVAAFNAANAADTLPPSVAFGWRRPRQGRHRPRRRQLQRRPGRPGLPAGSASGPEPARLQRARLARRRHRRRLGRDRGRRDLQRPVQRHDDHRQQLDGSVPASRRRPTSTASASSAARARPTSPSTRSSGRSTTTWT